MTTRIVPVHRIEINMGNPFDDRSPKKTYYVSDRNGWTTVKIPDGYRLPEMFEWLSENDALDQLVALEPTLEGNYELFLGIQNYRQIMRDALLGNNAALAALSKYPKPYQKAVWLFTNPDMAVLFKLTFGGVQ